MKEARGALSTVAKGPPRSTKQQLIDAMKKVGVVDKDIRNATFLERRLEDTLPASIRKRTVLNCGRLDL